MSEQRARTAVAADRRSIVPGIAGVPWWAAIAMAVTGVAAGFAFDAGSGKDLTIVFSALYVVGCAAAVLAVQQSGVFTAVIQPPLILFLAVPGAYFVFHGAKMTGVKDLVINCGYPLIERFPLMLLTSVGVLLVGLVRWLLGRLDADDADDVDKTDATEEDTADAGRPGLIATLASFFDRDPAVKETPQRTAKQRARREHAVERRARSADTDRRSGRRPAASTRTRRPRPAADGDDPGRERVRRRRPSEFDTGEPPRRSSRQPRDPDQRGRPSREARRDPHPRLGRPAARSGRLDHYEHDESFDGAAPRPRRRSASNGSTATHHPISQVRYRKSAGADDVVGERARRPRKPSADWDFDS